jgi:hypothetical protein
MIILSYLIVRNRCNCVRVRVLPFFSNGRYASHFAQFFQTLCSVRTRTVNRSTCQSFPTVHILRNILTTEYHYIINGVRAK